MPFETRPSRSVMTTFRNCTSTRLADPGPFYRVLHAVYAICTVLYSFVAVFGYIT